MFITLIIIVFLLVLVGLIFNLVLYNRNRRQKGQDREKRSPTAQLHALIFQQWKQDK